MTTGERLRLRFLFTALAAVPVFLCGWLGWLQVLQQGRLPRPGQQPLRLRPAAADVQRDRLERLPSPRGTIFDRHGATLAIDCDAYEVRAEVRPPRRARSDCRELRAYVDDLADRLSLALAADPGLADRSVARVEHRSRLSVRLGEALGLGQLPAAGPLPPAVPGTVEVLVASDVDVLPVIEGLYDLDDAMSSLHLHMQHGHTRVYPERDLTYGLVGYLEDLPVQDPQTGEIKGYLPFAPVGLEAMAALQPGAPGRRSYRVDSAHHRFFAGTSVAAARASTVVSTIDLELQKVATRELEAQALAAGSDGKSTQPQWGALVLVEIATGDVLAAASWHRDAKWKKGSAYTPYQLAYEPGSIVKPLLFAFALQHSGLDWNRDYDCSSTGHDHHTVVAETGRPVRDDHGCGTLTPHGILVNSSNIGAVKVGSLLTRPQWRQYLDLYGFGRTLDLHLPHERTGGVVKQSWDPSITEAAFRKWSASSYSIGYELQVTALQMARAFLTVLSGERRELRLVQAIEVDGVRHPVPAATAERVFDPAVVEAVSAAMTDVVSDAEGATGRHLVAAFRKEGVELHGLIAGKTGTAASQSVVAGRGRVEVRNASFVGFAPAGSPRYLAVCVLQKDDSARFYGGSYAAPPVARLLLDALRLEERRRLCREPQVSASPGTSGRGWRAPESSQAGR